jgi:hypothetical protein
VFVASFSAGVKSIAVSAQMICSWLAPPPVLVCMHPCTSCPASHTAPQCAASCAPQFLRMLRAGSADSLDVYDDRYGSNGSYGSLGSLSGLAASSSLADKSMRGSCHAGSLLDPIREAA